MVSCISFSYLQAIILTRKRNGIKYSRAITTTSLVRPYLARALLGWQPRKAGFIDGMATYYASYLASMGQVGN
jgi:hypothetical protein